VGHPVYIHTHARARTHTHTQTHISPGIVAFPSFPLYFREEIFSRLPPVPGIRRKGEWGFHCSSTSSSH